GATIGVLIGEGYNYFFNPTVEIPISGRRGGANRDSLKMEKGIDHRNFPLEDFLGQKGTPLFDVDSLKPKSPLPSYYNLMSENNLPSEMIETANELGSEPDLVQRVILENEVTPQADIQISTLLPFESRAGRVPILTPDHYELVSIQVTEEGQELQQGTDYKVYRVPNNGLYYFELSDNPIGLKFHYKATLSQGEFKTLPDPMFFLSRPHLLKAVESLKADGATELPHSLEEALESKNRLSLKEIDQIFSQTGFYTFDQEKSTLLWRMGEMKYDILNASRYLREGVYYYQCTGSNFLLGSFLSLAFDEAKIRTRVRVEQINGYVLNNEQGLLGLPGHRRTLVSDTRVPNQYMILDATPKKMDPKYLHLMDQHPFARLEKKEKPPDRRPIKRKLWAFLGRNELKEVDDVESSSPTPENEPIDDMDSIDPESPQVEESQKNKDESADLAEQAELLLDLKRKLRKRILQFLRSNGQSPQSNSVHSSMQELFFLIDRLASFLSKMTSRASLLDELISYRSGHYQAGMDYSQNMDFLEYKRQYMENYGSSREVTLEIVHSIIQRFSQFLHSFDLEVAKKIGNKHGYILDNEARTLAFHILHILEGKRIYSALSSDQEKCRFLLDK
ncbi:MAG: hypothetical protein KDD35_07405, partial [Bdellovibrionales bacterium]|nr:hypothetical protein [Bdellovibrionales bacterium]